MVPSKAKISTISTRTVFWIVGGDGVENYEDSLTIYTYKRLTVHRGRMGYKTKLTPS